MEGNRKKTDWCILRSYKPYSARTSSPAFHSRPLQQISLFGFSLIWDKYILSPLSSYNGPVLSEIQFIKKKIERCRIYYHCKLNCSINISSYYSHFKDSYFLIFFWGKSAIPRKPCICLHLMNYKARQLACSQSGHYSTLMSSKRDTPVVPCLIGTTKYRSQLNKESISSELAIPRQENVIVGLSFIFVIRICLCGGLDVMV